MYLIATTFFNECFFPFDNWKTLFLVKIYCNPKMFFNLDVRLVIFPMSGNNTVQTWGFVDPRFSSWGSDGASLSSTVFSLKNYCETWNKWFCVVFPKSLSFPAFWLEKNQRANSWENETSRIYKLIFKSIVKPVFINSNKNCLRPSEITWKILLK